MKVHNMLFLNVFIISSLIRHVMHGGGHGACAARVHCTKNRHVIESKGGF